MPQDSESDNKLSIAKVNRKIAKPIMEKKRRARINASLNELKTLLVEVLQKEGCRHSSKMEKADILEMAVRHLKSLQRQQSYPGSSSQTLRDGYTSTIPVDKYTQPLSSDCSVNQMNQLIGRNSGDGRLPQHISPHPPPDSTVSSPTANKLDSNRNILPTPKPIMINPSAIPNTTGPISIQPVMTQTGNGEIAVVLPQHLLKQNNTPGFIFPLYPPMTGVDNKSQPVMISINMPSSGQSQGSAFTKINNSNTSSLLPNNHVKPPVSPVWRPW